MTTLECRLALERLGDDADVADAGSFDGIHYGGEGAEGDCFVGADVDYFLFVRGILGEDGGEVVDVDGFVLEEDVLVFVDGDDEVDFAELRDEAGVGNGDLDAALQNRGGEHEDEEQNQDHVDQRRDVDVGHGGGGFTVGTEGHG